MQTAEHHREQFELAYATAWAKDREGGETPEQLAAEVKAWREGDTYGKDLPRLRFGWEGYQWARASQCLAQIEEPSQVVLYVSATQLDNVCDPESATAGSYMPVRKTPGGKLTKPLYAGAAPAAVASRAGNLLGIVRTAQAEARRLINGEDSGSDLAQTKLDLPETLRVLEHALSQPTAVAPQGDQDADLGRTVDQRDTAEGWADGLAGLIGKYFGRDIGEHSSAHCPWQEAKDIIEEAAPYQPVAVAVPALSLVERKALDALCALATASFHAADDSSDNGDIVEIPRADFEAMDAALDLLDELPDDQPGYTMLPAAKAAWALRRLLDALPALEAPTAPDLRKTRDKAGILHYLTPEQMAEEIVRLDARLAAAPQAPAAPVTLPWRTGIPQWTDDTSVRVIAVTAHDDFGGVQVHDIRASDFHADGDGDGDGDGAEIARACTHWAYRDDIWPRAMAAPAAPEGRLTKPARVGACTFGVGVPERTVIGAAQRYYESEGERLSLSMTAEQFADEERQRRALWELIHGPLRDEPTALHSDDLAVGRFCAELKAKLEAARAKGRSGWETMAPEPLSCMLREHVEKGDPVDVANFCMFLWVLGQPISADPAVDEDPLGLRDVGDALVQAIERNTDALKAVGWLGPMDCPSEIVVDLLNLLDEAKVASGVDASDTALLDAMERHRIAVAPEFEGPWDAELYEGGEEPQHIGSGATPREALRAVLAAQAEEGGAAC